MTVRELIKALLDDSIDMDWKVVVLDEDGGDLEIVGAAAVPGCVVELEL